MDPEPQMFNLTSDPDQMHSIHAEQPDLLARMKQLMDSEFNTTAINDLAVAWDALQYRTFVNYTGHKYPQILNDSSLRWHEFYAQDPDKFLGMIDKWLQAHPTAELAPGAQGNGDAVERNQYGVSQDARRRVARSTSLSLDGTSGSQLPDCSGGVVGSEAAPRLAAQLAVVRPELREGDCGDLSGTSYWDWDA